MVQGLESLLQKLRRGFGEGDSIRIAGGSWDNQLAVCNWSNEKGVNLTVSFLGHPQKIFVGDGQARFRLEEAAPPAVKPRKDRGYLVNLARGATA